MSSPAIFSLEGRTAVVTGASSGLGARFSVALAEAGATVLAAARRAQMLDQLAEQHPGIVPVVADVSDEGAREALVTRAVEATGRLDVLVNNAGVAGTSRAEDESLDDLRRTFEVNVFAAFHLAQLAARRMMEAGGGSIVNVASVLGMVAGAPMSAASYSSSKGAVINLTRELAVQWASRGVRVNALAPGWFDTEMTSGMTGSEKATAWVERNTPMRRFGRPDELDGALLFLASDASSFCTGSILTVDGGWTAR